MKSCRSRPTPGGSRILRRRRRKDAVTLIVYPNRIHDFWPGYFRCQELVDFAIKHARTGVDAGDTVKP